MDSLIADSVLDFGTDVVSQCCHSINVVIQYVARLQDFGLEFEGWSLAS
jgi:hypothetical protein